jgi:hypothetical protein
LTDELLIDVESFLIQPSFSNLSILMPSGFFVAVPKIESGYYSIADHIPQAVREMYACVKRLK